MERIYICCEGPVLMLGEDYSPIEKVSITESRFLFIKSDEDGKREIDERPSVRGRYTEKVGATHLRCTKDITLDAEFEILKEK